MFAYCYRDEFCLDYDTISKATSSDVDDEDEEIERKSNVRFYELVDARRSVHHF